MVSISVGGAVIVLVFHFWGNHQFSPVPLWVKKVLRMKLIPVDIDINDFGKGTFRMDYSSKSMTINNKLKRDNSFGLNNDGEVLENKELIEKILKITKHANKILEKNYLRKRVKLAIIEEWKQVARRVDLILFILHSTIVIATPIFLFGKYILINEELNSKGRSCDCKALNRN